MPNIYIHFLENNTWFPLELKDDKEAIDGAIRNKGIIRVEDIDGRIVWELANQVTTPIH